MNNDLSKLVEAVRAAHADIAPTYAEYVQLAFAIATDCGEAGRSDFISLCEPSPKFNALHANKLFSSALRTGNQNVHLGTAFHLAKLAGVEIGFKFQGFTKPFSSHTRTYIIWVSNKSLYARHAGGLQSRIVGVAMSWRCSWGCWHARRSPSIGRW